MRWRLLPKPKDLGHPNNHLPSRDFGHAEGAYTWEDWHEEVRRRFPVRYFLSGVVGWFARWPRVSNALYWLRTHTYNRYHLLDIRQAEPENPDGYRWGWIDRDRVLMLACFKVLRDFVELEKPWPVADYLAEVEAKGDPNGEAESLRLQHERYVETMALYNWWTRDRFAERAEWERRRDEAYKRWKAEPTDENGKAWTDIETTENDRDDEMLRRLIAIRHYLWT